MGVDETWEQHLVVGESDGSQRSRSVRAVDQCGNPACGDTDGGRTQPTVDAGPLSRHDEVVPALLLVAHESHSPAICAPSRVSSEAASAMLRAGSGSSSERV